MDHLLSGDNPTEVGFKKVGSDHLVIYNYMINRDQIISRRFTDLCHVFVVNIKKPSNLFWVVFVFLNSLYRWEHTTSVGEGGWRNLKKDF